jgi:hypothetical protein
VIARLGTEVHATDIRDAEIVTVFVLPLRASPACVVVLAFLMGAEDLLLMVRTIAAHIAGGMTVINSLTVVISAYTVLPVRALPHRDLMPRLMMLSSIVSIIYTDLFLMRGAELA